VRQLSAEPNQIELRERNVSTVEIVERSRQNRTRTFKVARGLVMKSDGQLNHSLDMPARRAVERQGAPDVLKLFMGVKEPGAVEEIDTSVEILVVGRHGQ
jgi:hypothetical protein